MISLPRILIHSAYLLVLAISVQANPGPGPQEAASQQQPQDINPETAAVRFANPPSAVEDPERLARLKRYSAADVEVELAARQAEHDAMLNRLETAISREELDEKWSAKTAGQLRASFQQAISNTEPDAGPAAVLVSAICRTTLCRIELAQTTPGSSTDGIMETALAGWSGAVVVNHLTELTTVIYAARPDPNRPHPE